MEHSGENDTKRKPGRPKGLPKTGGGSRRGIPNKTTAVAREAIARFVDGNTERLQGWLDEIAADERHGPLAAFRCLMDVMEYHVPKLARMEHAGEVKHGVIIQASPLDEAL